jgi:hypothetical protein
VVCDSKTVSTNPVLARFLQYLVKKGSVQRADPATWFTEQPKRQSDNNETSEPTATAKKGVSIEV